MIDKNLLKIHKSKQLIKNTSGTQKNIRSNILIKMPGSQKSFEDYINHQL